MLGVNKSVKRKYNEVPLCIKLDVIKELENGTSVYKIADKLNVHSTTVRLWQKKKDKINGWSSQLTLDVPKNKKRLNKEVMEHVNKAVWIWFRQKRALDVSLTGPMIKAQALRFNEKFDGEKTFTASNGWLRSWKKRYGVRAIGVNNKKLSAHTNTVDSFITKFLKYIKAENLTADQVFNVDKSHLYYKNLPKTNLCAKSKPCPSSLKGCKEEVTVMACCNVSGTYKVPLAIVGKVTKPQALKNMSSLPVSYKSQKNAWITKDLFASWFNDEFVPTVKEFLQTSGLPCKALLVMGNLFSDNITDMCKDGISIMFIPANTTASIQPMNQGCLQNLKMLYKQYFMQFVLDESEKDRSLIDIIKSVTIKECINWSAASWNKLSISTIQKSWNTVWPWDNEVEVCKTYLDQQEEINSVFRQFCNYLENLPNYKSNNITDLQQWLNSADTTEEKSSTDSEIVEVIRKENGELENICEINKLVDVSHNKDKENDNVNNNTVFPQKISKEEAQLYLNKLFTYCENNCTENSIKALNVLQKEIESQT